MLADPTLAPRGSFHRMGTVASRKVLINDPARKDQFSCTVDQLRRYFHTYELSRK